MYIPGVDKLIGKLEDVLAKEAELVWRVPSELKNFKKELESMQVFLIDADQGERHGHFAEEGEKKWLADIRDKSYEAEDIIDEFTYHMIKHERHDDVSCFSWCLHLLVEAPTTLWVMHQTAHKLQNIKKSITDIAERHTKYKSGADASESARGRYLEQQQAVRNLRDGAYSIKEGNFIGFHRQIESLQQWLTNDKSSRLVISVYGMGGAGKTTLAAKIYKSQSDGFEFSEWIAISQTYSITELLRSLIKKNANINEGERILSKKRKKKVSYFELMSYIDLLSYVELVETLESCLKGKKYLIVLDDVWDTKCWEEMKVAFPDDEVGSRIVITTRNEMNAPSSPYKLHVEQLQGSEPWDLFSMKAFADYPNKTCPQELESLARELVDKCRGLPLALVTLGGLMSSKKQETEWKDAYKSLYKTPHMGYMKNVLMLSFSELPYSLKHCFLYCCIFPEDYSIKRKRLIRMWIAQGFVGSGDELTLEEVADSYLSELVFRGMLLVEARNVSRRPKVIKMHDVIRDVALEIAKNEKFCGVCDGREVAINKSHAYRWSIIDSENLVELKLPSSDMSQVRSLSVFGDAEVLRKHLLKFKMLRMLDVEYCAGHRQFAEVGSLFNLKYLKVSGWRLCDLPSSIGRLLNLETLDISETRVKKLPEEVSKLRKLSHLILRRPNDMIFHSVSIAFDISKLNKLQVLIGLSVHTNEGLRQLGALTQLKSLVIDYRMKGGLWSWETLGQLKHLQRLQVMSFMWQFIGPSIANLEILALNLKKLHLEDSNVRFQSRWFDSLRNIQEMTLIRCILSEDQLPRIGALEKLVSLRLSIHEDEDEEEEEKQKLHFCGGFAKLKQLSFDCFYSYHTMENNISFERGVMPHLESLTFRHHFAYCIQEFPKGMEHLTNLQKLELLVPKECVDRFQEATKIWKSKVQHIPTIIIKKQH